MQLRKVLSHTFSYHHGWDVHGWRPSWHTNRKKKTHKMEEWLPKIHAPEIHRLILSENCYIYFKSLVARLQGTTLLSTPSRSPHTPIHNPKRNTKWYATIHITMQWMETSQRTPNGNVTHSLCEEIVRSHRWICVNMLQSKIISGWMAQRW